MVTGKRNIELVRDVTNVCGQRQGVRADNSTDWCVGRRPELKSVELSVVPRLVIDVLSLLCEIAGDYVV